MGVMDKFIQYMKFNDAEDDEYLDDDDSDDEDEPIEPKQPSVIKRNNVVKEDIEEPEKFVRKTPSNKITQMRQSSSKRMPVGNGMEVCVMKPTSIEDAREITDTLLSNRTVVLNLELADRDVAKRTIDFLAGVAYSISGQLKNVANNIYVITPCNVDIHDETNTNIGLTSDSLF
jgi:cell division inhibitor SepF